MGKIIIYKYELVCNYQNSNILFDINQYEINEDDLINYHLNLNFINTYGLSNFIGFKLITYSKNNYDEELIDKLIQKSLEKYDKHIKELKLQLQNIKENSKKIKEKGVETIKRKIRQQNMNKFNM